MKKIILIGLCIVVSMLGVAHSKSFGPKHDKVVKIFQGSQEPTAKDAVWTSKDMFKVGVINDGSNRNGYAQYVCQVLSEEGFSGVRVQVIDIVKLTQSGSWVKLGEARCR